MPILKGAATFARFRVEPDPKASHNWGRVLPPALRVKAFQPLDREGTVDRSAGFAELEDWERTEFEAGELFSGEFALFTWRVDEFRIPSSLVRAELEKWAKEFEKEHQRRPGRREKNDAKLEIRHNLRQKAPVVTRTFDVSWNLQENRLQIWSASRKMVDEVQEAIEGAIKVRLEPLVPVVVARLLGIDERTLAPTPGLSLPESKAKAEVAREKA